VPEGTTVYLRATTKGGVVSGLKKITVSFKCGYKVEQTPTYDEVIVPFEDGKQFVPFPSNNVEPLNGNFKFTTPDAARCPMTHVFLYASEADYESNSPKANMPVLYSDLNVDLTVPNQGKTEYFFAITGKKDPNGEYIRSNLGKATVYICGLETITLAKEGVRAIGLEKDKPSREIPYDEYSAWFKIEASDPGATTKCGIKKGKEGITPGGNTDHAAKGEGEIEFVEGKGLVIDIQKALSHPD